MGRLLETNLASAGAGQPIGSADTSYWQP